MCMVRQNLNGLINLAREETEDILILSMIELEKERNTFRELHHKALQELKDCKGKVEEQPSLLRTAAEEVNLLRGDLVNAHTDASGLSS